MATSKELLTNLADELRTLTNTTDKMGLSKMAEHVSDANAEVDEQSAVVDELMAALQGKSVPGGSETPAYETCTVHVKAQRAGTIHLSYITLADGVPTCVAPCSTYAYDDDIEVIVGSFIVFGANATAPTYFPMTVTGDIECINSSSLTMQTANTCGFVFKINGDGTITSNSY